MKRSPLNEVKKLTPFPFDLSTEVEEPVKLPDLQLTKNIAIPMYGTVTVAEFAGISTIKSVLLEERMEYMVLVFLRSRSHPGWTLEQVKSLGDKLIIKAFNAFSSEIAAANNANVEDTGKLVIQTGLLSTGDFVVDIQVNEDSTQTNSEIAL